MLVVSCPNCQKLLQVADTAADQESVCPACRTVFQPNILHQAGIQTHQIKVGGLSQLAAIDTADSPAELELRDSIGTLVTTTFADEWRKTVRQKLRRRRVLSFGIGGAVVVGLIFLYLLQRTMDPAEAIVSALLCSLVSFVPLLVIAKILPALDDLKNGFLKAAGRPTQPSSEYKLDQDLHNEDLP